MNNDFFASNDVSKSVDDYVRYEATMNNTNNSGQGSYSPSSDVKFSASAITILIASVVIGFIICWFVLDFSKLLAGIVLLLSPIVGIFLAVVVGNIQDK